MLPSSTSTLTTASRTISLILNREGATLVTLRDQLIQLRQVVSQLPTTVCWSDDFSAPSSLLAQYKELRTAIGPQWPGLGFYDAASFSMEISQDTSEVGDALDDLADLVKDLNEAVQLAATDLAGDLSWLRFTADTHWGYHVDDLVRHLNFIVAHGAATERD